MDGAYRYFHITDRRIVKCLRELAWSPSFLKPIDLLAELLELLMKTYWKLNTELSSKAEAPQFETLMNAIFSGNSGSLAVEIHNEMEEIYAKCSKLCANIMTELAI